jgi:hypothetical protein
VISLFHGKYVPIKLARDLEVLVNVGHVVLVVLSANSPPTERC